MIKKSLIIFILFGLITCSYGLEKGGSTAEFLIISSDARSIGMGESLVYIQNDVYGCYWNPAGLSGFKGLNLGYSHQFWFMDFNYDSFVFSYSLMDKGTVGGYINTLWMSDDIQEVDIYGNILDGQMVENRFFSLGLLYAFNPIPLKWFSDKNELLTGVSVKLISQKIYKHDASGMALDVGFIEKNIFMNKLYFGLALQNLGFNGSFLDEGETESLPFKLNLGLSYEKGFNFKGKYMFSIIPALKYGYANNYGSTLSFGTEMVCLNMPQDLNLILRLGYLVPLHKYFNTGLKTGMGIIYNNITFDYAVSLYSEINYTHAVTVKYKY